MYEEKIAAARTLLTNHFNCLEPITAEEKVNGFFVKLKNAGGTDDETIKLCTYEDLESFGAPKLLAKQIAGIFRKGETEKPKIHKPSHVAVMNWTELFAHYNPLEQNAVFDRLEKAAKGRCCVVFSGNTIDVENSTTLLSELIQGYPERETLVINGIPTKVYKIGERVNQLADENPLYPGRALRPNGDCDQTNRSWNGVSEVSRKVIYLALTQTSEISVTRLNDAHSLLDFVMNNQEAAIRARYVNASLLYENLKQKGNLPSLKIDLNGGSSKKQNPFGNKTY